MLAAWRGREARASELIEATLQEATAGGLGSTSRPMRAPCSTTASVATTPRATPLGDHSSAIWSLRALCPARAGRGGVQDRRRRRPLRAALEWLSERTRVTPSDWASGSRPASAPCSVEGDAADGLYRESIARLDRTRSRRARPRPSAVRRVAAPRAPPRGRARAAAHRPRDAGRDGHGGVRRAGQARAPGHRRDRPQADGRDALRPHRAGDPDRAARRDGPRTPRSAHGCSSVREPSKTTCAKSSSSSTSARATSSTGSSRATPNHPAALAGQSSRAGR